MGADLRLRETITGTILVADDHTIVREGLKQILAKHSDLQVAGEAANGNDVLRLIRDGRDGQWDVLVTDMSMPGRNGLELIKLVKQTQPALPVLVLSMYDEEQYAVRAIRAGASGYLNKESASEQLVSAIRRVRRLIESEWVKRKFLPPQKPRLQCWLSHCQEVLL